jgi:hypothetical protein
MESPFNEEGVVLKITETLRKESAITFKLEGKVLAPWLDELRRICAQPPNGSRRISLDLAGVTFVDAAAAELMRELIRQGIAVTRCSGFVAELLHVGKK